MFDLSRYEVTGTVAVLGHQPGSVFEDDLDPAIEQRLLARGALRKLPPLVVVQPRRHDDPQPDLPPRAAEPKPTTKSQQEG